MFRRLILPLLGALALGLTALVTPLAAHADGDSNDVGACLSADKVWLLVVTDTDKVLANECVGTPATGTEALTAAGLELSRDGSNFICAIGGYPSPCPAKFNGQFWNYYQGKPGAEYGFSQVGADEAKPEPGTIEAWCYNKADQESCTPPYLKIVQAGKEVAAPAGATVQDLPVTGAKAEAPAEQPAAQDQGNSSTMAIVIGVVVLAAVVVVFIVARMRNSGKGDGAVGGR